MRRILPLRHCIAAVCTWRNTILSCVRRGGYDVMLGENLKSRRKQKEYFQEECVQKAARGLVNRLQVSKELARARHGCAGAAD